jgi:hypothetical protein
MSHELKFFFIRLGALILVSPLIGFFLVRFFEHFEKIWKSGSRRKKWLMMSSFIFMLACFGGFLLPA